MTPIRPRSASPARARAALAVLAAWALAAVAPAPADAYQLAEGLTLNGQFFGDLTLAETDAESGFHNKRNYVIVVARIEPTLAFHFTLDQNNESDQVFVKYAYLDKALPHAVTIHGGMVPTPYAPWDNSHFWGLRFVEKAFTQYWGALTTADLGVAVQGTVAGATALFYHVAFLNGEGFQNTPDGEGFALAAHLGARVKQLHFGGFLHEENARNGTSTYDPSREGVYAFWDDPRFRVGAQGMIADDGNAATFFDGGDGVNVQGRVKLPVGVETWAFGRYDVLDPMDTGASVSLLIIGVTTRVAGALDVAPNIRRRDDGTDTETIFAVHAKLDL